MKILNLFIASILAIGSIAQAQVSDELESLGSNRGVNERANLLENRTRVGIVQGRAVDRNMRFELGASYGPTATGDAYLSTQNSSVRADFHINPRWSLGVQYTKMNSTLTSEAKLRYDQARVDKSAAIPQVAYPDEAIMGLVNWYMTYGKINVFDWKTVQFDIYALGGLGQIKVSTDIYGETKSKTSNIWTAGLGLGFWLTQHVSTRGEIRYQSFEDYVYTGSRQQGQAVATIGLGVLL